MLTRIYVDNFRALVNFEVKLKSKQLVIGRSGSGKSTFFDAVLAVRHFVVRGDTADDLRVQSYLTRWLGHQRQTFEIEALIEGDTYVYKVVFIPLGDPPNTVVESETVSVDGKPLFAFVNGEVELFDDRFERKAKYDFDPRRSALVTAQERGDTQRLTRFKRWFATILFFRLNPFNMTARSEREEVFPTVDLSNFAAWYRHLVQDQPEESNDFSRGLKEALDDFSYLRSVEFGQGVRILTAEFGTERGKSMKFHFAELSEGQRCLICLYAILNFVATKKTTVFLDEPDNFVALREIQPWLVALDDAIEAHGGQALIITHHPEILNQWAARHGLTFARDGIGPVRVTEFQGDVESGLPPAELIARGWERD